MTYRTCEIEGDQHFANGDYEQALGAYKSAIRLTDDPYVIDKLKVKRVRSAEKAFPSRWTKFWTTLGVSW